MFTLSAGYVVSVNRIDGFTDQYKHLNGCAWSGTHSEQGDLVAVADGSGTASTGPHLHFQVNDSSGRSVRHCLSGICDFSAATRQGQTFISDSAGPGMSSNTYAWGAIRGAYVNLGHFLCAGVSWNCFGSSMNLLGEGPMATRSCLGASGDCGWHQDFLQAKWNDFNWPEVCPKAYWIPDQFFSAYLNNTWLGQARSSVYLDQFLGYTQRFRHGLLYSPTFGGPPVFTLSGNFTACID